MLRSSLPRVGLAALAIAGLACSSSPTSPDAGGTSSGNEGNSGSTTSASSSGGGTSGSSGSGGGSSSNGACLTGCGSGGGGSSGSAGTSGGNATSGGSSGGSGGCVGANGDCSLANCCAGLTCDLNSNLCVGAPDGGDGGSCGLQGDGGSCVQLADCAQPLVCDSTTGACVPPGPAPSLQCSPNGHACGAGQPPCCGGPCTSGFCAPRAVCALATSPCQTSADCCAGLTCDVVGGHSSRRRGARRRVRRGCGRRLRGRLQRGAAAVPDQRRLLHRQGAVLPGHRGQRQLLLPRAAHAAHRPEHRQPHALRRPLLGLRVPARGQLPALRGLHDRGGDRSLRGRRTVCDYNTAVCREPGEFDPCKPGGSACQPIGDSTVTDLQCVAVSLLTGDPDVCVQPCSTTSDCVDPLTTCQQDGAQGHFCFYSICQDYFGTCPSSGAADGLCIPYLDGASTLGLCEQAAFSGGATGSACISGGNRQVGGLCDVHDFCVDGLCSAICNAGTSSAPPCPGTSSDGGADAGGPSCVAILAQTGNTDDLEAAPRPATSPPTPAAVAWRPTAAPPRSASRSSSSASATCRRSLRAGTGGRPRRRSTLPGGGDPRPLRPRLALHLRWLARNLLRPTLRPTLPDARRLRHRPKLHWLRHQRHRLVEHRVLRHAAPGRRPHVRLILPLRRDRPGGRYRPCRPAGR